MGWLSDAWREVTTGGRARTQTFNGRGAQSSASSSSPRRPVQTPAAQSAPTRIMLPGGGGGGRGGLAAAVPVAAPARQSAQRSTGGTGAAAAAATAAAAQQRAQAATLARASAGRATTPEQDDDWLRNAIRQNQQQGQDARDAARGAPGESRTNQERADRAIERKAREQQPQPPVVTGAPQRRTIELTRGNYEKMSPLQRAGLLFNTGLVEAARQDAADGGETNTRSFLTDLDLLNDTTDVDSYLGLDQAIGMNILSKLDDLTTRQQSAESLRYARGNTAAAPQAAAYSAAAGNAAAAAATMADRLSLSGLTSLRGNTQAAGFGDSVRDAALRRAYDLMVDSSVQQSADDIAEGLAILNQSNGTDISPQELWDFARLQLDAADFSSLRGGPAVVPVSDTSITPLSVREIRERYGL